MPLLHLQDLPAALGLLSRLPVKVDTDLATTRGAMSAWAWPLVGIVIGLITGLVALLSQWLGLPVQAAAILVLTTQILLTGALHEDGLADCADGFWGGYDRERRLEIMKDSRIGAYGVIAIVLSLLARAGALIVVLSLPSPIFALIAVGVISRVPMVILMAGLPNARGTGLAQSVGRPGFSTGLLATGFALILSAVLLGWIFVPLTIWVAITATVIAFVAHRKIGGQTGDVLGASQQIAEISALFVLTSLAT
ncbi:adenosylcobinamide-GDP ribazoletransferase [Aliiroseovarius sp. KMU-50]|uniref:Adenosylcobinamide-GDP ribazoletransferase n=1 Tax=Aliiroseovarius salicola TaxID=3009082 RepID=A0ABT4W214_9RHOB|nr:adenosylcobinamide-GDP ribazoletransferase [Aliiroseovarius sp. KMU-50]MDA5094558.1 adenosylcobinamide-GDP ribazoletransferase [Aliiroseovarius sp. KMU-50]